MRRTVAPIALALALHARAAAAQHHDADHIARDAATQCERGDGDGAMEAFRRALAIEATGRVVGEMALCEHRMERWLDAEGHLRDALAMGDDAWLRHHRALLDAAMAETRLHVGDLTLTCSVEGAELRVNGEVVGRAPLAGALHIPSGVVRLEARAAGYRTWQRAIDLPGGGVARENIGLERDVPVAATTSAPAVACPPGLVMRSGLCYAPEPTEEERSRIRPTQVMLWTGVAVTVLASGVALGVGLSGDSTESDYLSRCGGPAAPASCVQDRADLQGSLDAQAGIVNAMIAVAVLGAGTAVVGAVLDQRAARRARVALTGNGLRVSW